MLLSESKQVAAEVVLKKLQEKIELQYLLMQKRHESIQKNTSNYISSSLLYSIYIHIIIIVIVYVASSKQRS